MKVLADGKILGVQCTTSDVEQPKTNEIQQMLSTHEDNRIDGLSEISVLLPCLFLCGASSAAHPNVLENLRVSFVINCAPELPDTPLPDSNPLYLRVSVMDHPSVDLRSYFDEVADLIEEVRLSGGKTLVHCVAGVSRSASLCLVYLMKYMGMTLREAFFHVKTIRPQIRPNMGFFRQLISYEESLRGESSIKWIFYESLQQEIPDVYESEYKNTELFYQKYRRNIKRR